MKHELPPLPYAADALEPHISAETLEYHHGRHHRKYVDKLNELIQGTGFEESSLDDIVSRAGDGALYDNAAQVWNHTFYWHCMSPDGGGEPQGPLAEAINASFGSYEGFQQEFEEAAKGLFGSGWVWLVKTTSETLAIQATKDAENPIRHGRVVLMTCDLWEHAFYIDYRNDKGAYMSAFWSVINWDFVAERFSDGRSSSPA